MPKRLNVKFQPCNSNPWWTTDSTRNTREAQVTLSPAFSRSLSDHEPLPQEACKNNSTNPCKSKTRTSGSERKRLAAFWFFPPPWSIRRQGMPNRKMRWLEKMAKINDEHTVSFQCVFNDYKVCAKQGFSCWGLIATYCVANLPTLRRRCFLHQAPGFADRGDVEQGSES